MPRPKPVYDVVRYETYHPDSWFTVKYNDTQDANSIQVNVQILNTETLNLYFGDGTNPSDMVSFSAPNNGVFDRFGNSASAITDTTQNWLNVTTTPLNSSYTEFYASRFVNSSDTSGRDTSIPCNTTTSYFWQLLPSNTNGTWDLIMDENCHPLITEPVAEHATKLILGATALITLSLL